MLQSYTALCQHQLFIESTLGVDAMGPHQARGKAMEHRRPEGVARGQRCSMAHRTYHEGRFLSPTRGKQGFPQRFRGPGSMWPHCKNILPTRTLHFTSTLLYCRVGVDCQTEATQVVKEVRGP